MKMRCAGAGGGVASYRWLAIEATISRVYIKFNAQRLGIDNASFQLPYNVACVEEERPTRPTTRRRSHDRSDFGSWFLWGDISGRKRALTINTLNRRNNK